MSKGRQKAALITGASSGIGKEAAKALVARGWLVIGTGRDAARMAAAEAEIAGCCAEGGRGVMVRADLALLAEAERLARVVSAITPTLDLLANNAGGMANDLVMTPEGLEANFAGNHLGPYLLTERLLPLLRAAAKDAPAGAVRIVNTSSDASEMIPGIDLADIQNLKNWSVGAAYCTSKLANVLHARELGGRLAGSGIVVHAFHPGTIDSNFFSHAPESTRQYTRDLPKLSEADGADTLLWLALEAEAGTCSGLYWHQRALRQPHALVEDAGFGSRFREASEALLRGVGSAGDEPGPGL